MNHQMNIEYFRHLIDMIPTIDFQQKRINPLLEYARHTNHGKLENLSHHELASVLHMSRELACLWDGSRTITMGELVRRSIAAAQLSDDDRQFIAEILALAYEAANSENTEVAQDVYVPFDFGLPQTGREETHADPIRITSWGTSLAPRRLYDQLGLTVYGQESARRAMALLLYHHMNGNARHLLIAGPTGCGKSLLVNAARALYKNIVLVDGSQLTMKDYRGDIKIGDIFTNLTEDDAQTAIVVIDEADKMFEPDTNSFGTNYSYRLQNELLKLMEGGTVQTKVSTPAGPALTTISTERISFVFLGSFETLIAAKNGRQGRPSGIGFGSEVTPAHTVDYNEEFTSDDLVEYANVRREIAGRIGHIVQMRPLVVDDYVRIIDDRQRGPLPKLEREYGFSLELSEDDKLDIARRAEASGLGVRSITTQLQDRFDDELFSLGDARRMKGHPKAA